jgi:hypothetical protein
MFSLNMLPRYNCALNVLTQSFWKELIFAHEKP